MIVKKWGYVNLFCKIYKNFWNEFKNRVYFDTLKWHNVYEAAAGAIRIKIEKGERKCQLQTF